MYRYCKTGFYFLLKFVFHDGRSIRVRQRKLNGTLTNHQNDTKLTLTVLHKLKLKKACFEHETEIEQREKWKKIRNS